MSEKTTEQLRDEAVTAGIELADAKREAARTRALLEEKTGQLVAVTIERDELARELTQVQGAERAARRMVIRARIDGTPYVSVEELAGELDSGGAP